MLLAEYLKSVTQQALAARIGCSQGLVSQWVNGDTVITAERAKAIEEATGGAVKRHELRPDIFDAPRKRSAA
jgi:DNA-binding transcriptional regulator YdaS (Cro superfamily)